MPRSKRRTVLHPIMAFIILICTTIILSGILKLFGLGANYNAINSIKGDIDSTTVSVTSLLNLSGLKLIFKSTVLLRVDEYLLKVNDITFIDNKRIINTKLIILNFFIISLLS